MIAVKTACLLEVETVVKNEEIWDDPTEAEQLVAEGFLQAQRLNGNHLSQKLKYTPGTPYLSLTVTLTLEVPPLSFNGSMVAVS